MCNDVLRLRAQLGGDWVVTFGLPTRSSRDIVRNQLGATIVELTAEEATIRERLMKRENGNLVRVKNMLTCRDEFEKVENSEKVIQIAISSKMTLPDVVKEIVQATIN